MSFMVLQVLTAILSALNRITCAVVLCNPVISGVEQNTFKCTHRLLCRTPWNSLSHHYWTAVYFNHCWVLTEGSKIKIVFVWGRSLPCRRTQNFVVYKWVYSRLKHHWHIFPCSTMPSKENTESRPTHRSVIQLLDLWLKKKPSASYVRRKYFKSLLS